MTSDDIATARGRSITLLLISILVCTPSSFAASTMGNAQVKRYIGGKKPQKYFDEDLWPELKHTFQKLGLDQGKGYELFMAFSRVDNDQSGKVSVKECMTFFGGHVSKYTERVFDVLDIGERDGLEFPEFVCALWNFCTMYTVLLARHMFEIFDPDSTGELERPDVEAVYRMIYDSDDHEPKLTDAFPYDEHGKVSRQNFIQHIKSNRHFIKPAASYQTRVRKALGGFIMWETLTNFRKRTFAEIDETSASLDEAVERILNSDYIKREKEELEQEDKDRIERDAILRRAAELQGEMKRREEEKDIEERRRKNQLDDENVNLAWMAYEALLCEFEATVFNKNDTWRRKEARDALYDRFDLSCEVTEQHWAHKYHQEYSLVCPEGGMPVAEKEHRLRDLMSSEGGIKEKERVETLSLLELVRARIIKKLSSDDPMINSIDGIVSNLRLSTDTIESASIFAKQLAKWGETKKAKNGLHEKMLDLVMNNAIDVVTSRQARETEDRQKQYKRKEFEIVTKHGARDTRWECVYDARKRQHITINVDTMQVLAAKFCICESCDATIDPADFKCYSCGAGRSVKNMKFYRALGT